MIPQIIGAIAAVVIVLFLLWKFYFLRNPEREITKKGITSPADGVITDIMPFEKPEVEFRKGKLGRIKTMTSDVTKKGYLISIFMSLTDVHYQRAPMTGLVTLNKHYDGKFRLGLGFMKSLQNERNEIMIRDRNLAVKVVQVAGFLARRIEAYVSEGQHMNKGDILGRINFGSHVALVMPRRKLMVKKGDRVRAGVTVIAE